MRIVLAIAAFWALRRELSGVDVGTLGSHLQRYGWSHLTLGLSGTVASFLVLGVVEIMATRQVHGAFRARVPARAALGTAFVANALSQSVGIALLTGATVRARAYVRHGLDAVAIAQVTAFVTVTTTVGLLAASAAALFVARAPVTIGPAAIAARPLGVLLASVVCAYLVWSMAGRGDSIGYGRWRLTRPSPRVATSQVLLSTVDWLLAGAVLFAFMPASPELSLGTVLGAYMIAQIVAVTSHVPAGAGVFEVVVLALVTSVSPSVSHSAVVAALVMFRVMYYLAPLCVAILVATLVELARSRPSITRGREAAYHELRVRRAD